MKPMNDMRIKQKLIFVSIILLSFIFQVRVSKTFASPPAPTPRCYVDGEESFQSCDSLYPIGVVKEIVINKDKITNNTIPAVKQKITGTVRSFWWATFDNYTVTSIENAGSTMNFFERIKAFVTQIGHYFRF